ncbi:MAG: class I SAM-dependent methyltransferase [Thermomicrobiales bacterium]
MADGSRHSGAEWNAEIYHRVSNPHVNWGAKVIERLALRGDETVMDAGCGTGRLTADLLERLPTGHVIALDQSQNMLDVARDNLVPRYGDRVSFVQADLQALDPAVIGKPVDVIFSTAAFHWVLDHPRLFAALCRVLTPGGWLVAQCGGGPNLAVLLSHAADLMATPRYAPFFAGWSGPWEFADDVTTAERLRAAGFVDVETSLEEAQTRLADAATFREYLTTVIFGAHLARIPHEELREGFVDHLTDLAVVEDPPFFLDYWRLNLRGRRPE